MRVLDRIAIDRWPIGGLSEGGGDQRNHRDHHDGAVPHLAAPTCSSRHAMSARRLLLGVAPGQSPSTSIAESLTSR